MSIIKFLSRLRQIGLLCALEKLKHHILLDNDVKSICALNGAYEYLQRYKLSDNVLLKEYIPTPAQKTIWTCWLQGIDNAPPIVKKCIESIKRYAGDYEVQIIDNCNFSQYITIPDYIIKKHELGIIPHAHFSDIIRLALLEQYGGIWIDSTIWLTNQLPDYVTQSDLFLFRGSNLGNVLIANPFIASKPHHPIIYTTLQYLLSYWKNEKHLVSYSIFHLFFTMAVNATPLNQSLYNKIPNVSSSQIFYLVFDLGKDYDEHKYNLALKLSSIHKLTYKYKGVNLDTGKKGTLYQHILQC